MALGLLWKKTGVGSQEALGHLKRSLGLPGRAREGIGHTGVLDPFAEGWLLCGTEEGTKLMAPLSGLDKTYETTLRLGWTTSTLDSESEAARPEGIAARAVLDFLTRDLCAIEAELKTFLSERQHTHFEQIPPQFSAVHVDGKRAYDWARKGVEKELKAKTVGIFETEHQGVERGEGESLLWHFRLRVASGTYIRSLARDWATELCHFPGHLTRLVRLSIGSFGRGVPAADWQPLGIDDLGSQFDIQMLGPTESERLRRYGRWEPRPSPRRCLLVGAGGVGAVAWTEEGSGRLGRVFLSDPFA